MSFQSTVILNVNYAIRTELNSFQLNISTSNECFFQGASVLTGTYSLHVPHLLLILLLQCIQTLATIGRDICVCAVQWKKKWEAKHFSVFKNFPPRLSDKVTLAERTKHVHLYI